MDRFSSSETSPLVSVIIPFYRYAGWLAEAVESVLRQTYRNYEIIVVNDGSPENIDEFLAKYEGKIRYFYKENGKAASARNLGIRQAKGEYVAFLDSDDLWKPDKLSVQISKMMEQHVVWSYTDFEVFGDQISTTLKQMSKNETGVYSAVSPYIGTPTVVIEREVLISNDLFFQEGFWHGEDSLLWRRIIDRFPILYIRENLASVRIRGTNAGRQAAVQIRARVDVYRKCVELIPGYRKKTSLLYKFAILLCRFGCLFVKKDPKKGKKFNEFVASVFLFLPYLFFKLDRIWEKVAKRAWRGLIRRIKQAQSNSGGNNVFVLMFHDLHTGENNLPALDIRKDDFIRFLEELQKKDVEFTSIDGVFSDGKKKKCIVTLDDVYEGAVLHAVPVLEQYGIPYTLFISPYYVDKRGFITSARIAELCKDPLCTIGYHSKSHQMLKGLGDEELAGEIDPSAFEKQYGISCDYFAYPFGSVYACPKSVIRKVRSSKFKAAFGTIDAPSRAKMNRKDPYFIPRINVCEATWKDVLHKF